VGFRTNPVPPPGRPPVGTQPIARHLNERAWTRVRSLLAEGRDIPHGARGFPGGPSGGVAPPPRPGRATLGGVMATRRSPGCTSRGTPTVTSA